MDLLDWIWKIKRFGLENVFRRYYSFYPAKVSDIEDPENRKRIKVIVPDIADEEPLAHWAEPLVLNAGKDESASSSKTGGKFGSFTPPKVDDYVWVVFRMGDIRAPLYFGGWWAKDEVPEFLDDEHKNAIFISRQGHKITVDETPGKGKINIETNNSTQIEFDDTDGSEKLTIKDKNGDEWKWDIASKTWTITFTGDKEETIEGGLKEMIEKAVEQTFNDTLKQTIEGKVEQMFNDGWKAEISGKTEIESSQSASLKQPKIAIGNGGIELLLTIYTMMQQLSTLKVLTPVGPSAPLTASAEWPQVQAEMVKIQTITGTF